MKLWFPFKFTALTGSAIVTFALLGCGNVDPGKNDGQSGAGGMGEGGSAGTPPTGPTGSLLPWVVGNSWTYDVTQDGVVSAKTTTLLAEEEVGGTGPNATQLAFHVSTTKGANGNDHTESWQAAAVDNHERIVRYREQSFSATTGDLQLEEHWDAEKLHIDGSPDRSVAGATWLERYDETKLEVGLPATTHAVSERWTVLADDETLVVPAGTFEHVIHLRKVGTGTSKEYWYVRGVGKLKETGSQTEELTSYSVEDHAP